ncbi:MAG: isoamylase [Myxococcota bacterium]
MSGTKARWAQIEGASFPLGVSWIAREHAFNFALYSKHATEVTLLLYAEGDPTQPVLEKVLDPRVHKSGRVWHCRVARKEAPAARYYAYRVNGPAPSPGVAWNDFDPEKILVDPYAPAVYFPPAFDREAAKRPGSNAGQAPLGILEENLRFEWSGDRHPRHEHDAIIYELHVRGFTRHPSSGVDADARGTYAGLIQKIPYLVELGVTVVELMPVFQFDPQEKNYWGYMPLNFFAPHHGYAVSRTHGGQHDEFRAMVRALHQAGLEVVIDAVYNHTVESDHTGPTYSYRGIDNASYYYINDHATGRYDDFSGTGNALNFSSQAVRKMVVDSMRHWIGNLHVDGFRFDLASVFTRNRDGTINYDDPPVLSEINADPELATARLIAEPWDAAGAYQLGRKFPGINWLQWNGNFRDDLRRFVRGDPGMVGKAMLRLYGSDDLFPDAPPEDAYHAFQSVNYIGSHDGLSLNDLVSYNEKNNWANGHENTDGPSENLSYDYGHAGTVDVPEDVAKIRRQQVKNFAALLFLANGTPMFRAGDEFLKTQGGNSNPYNQDNEVSWLDWRALDENRDIFRFFQRMIAFRKAHRSIARSRFWRDDVHWFGTLDPEVDFSHESHCFAYHLQGSSQGDVDLYVMVNMWVLPVPFRIHAGEFEEWVRVVDTSREAPFDYLDRPEPVSSAVLNINGRSLVVLERSRRAR